MRILACSDSDSYLKWSRSLLAGAPRHWHSEHVVVENVIAPSPAQVRAAAPDTEVRRLGLRALVRRIVADPPEVLLTAATGPALETITEALHRAGALGVTRPVLVTGLPGISFPANDLAVRFRRSYDLFILHSHREIRGYQASIQRLGVGPRPVLATLPFWTERRPSAGHRVIFAAQSLVPPDPQDRSRILAALAKLPPELEPVVKVRALAGERQAHNETHPYAQLWQTMEHPRELAFEAGAMDEALRRAGGFVTVSSTAALEAIAAGVPSLVLSDFGVNEEMINTVFEGSGLLGTLADLQAGWFREPDADWCRDNYFHDPSHNDWIEAIEKSVRLRAAGGLPPISFDPWPDPGQRRRFRLRLLPPGWVWSAARSARRNR